MIDHTIDISNVLVIGCGGAGLRAAIEAKKTGVDVKVLGKRKQTDSHTALAAGGINASFGNIDIEDNWEYHFADTFFEGYGIGNPKIIEIMAKESPAIVEEIDQWGANFERTENRLIDQRFFGAHTFRRTCYSGDHTGKTILKVLLDKAKQLNIPIFDSQYVTELLINDDGVCFGALSFNIYTGERTIHYTDALIICTGGHTRIWKKSSSRKQENTGDGFFLGLKAGCKLIDMEMVQFHPTGMLLPDDIAGTLVTEAVRGEGGLLFNSKGERYMKNYDPKRMELSTRDRVAIANYTEIIEGRCTENGGVYLDISHIEKDVILKKLPTIYRQFIEYQMLDITKKPMEVAPTAHYSMGGIEVEPQNHSTNVKGIFAAGEVSGGLHGANRLGGNSLAEILVFGKNVGKAAADYSRNLSSQARSMAKIKLSHESINQFIKPGSELVIILQDHLQETMWKYCGVVKDQKNLEIGLSKVRDLKSQINDVDVRLEDNNFNDLVNILDLNSSLLVAEATILSSIARKESRGAHQRKDFPKLDSNQNCNYSIMEVNKILKLSKLNIEPLSQEYCNIINGKKNIEDINGKLLE